jgi:LPXTG-site transpeptidase (sortase) family protein
VLGNETEQLNKGVGQHIGSQNPGEMGIIILSAHFDFHAELFRSLDNLVPGDSIFLYTNERKFEYMVEKSQVVNTKKADIVFSPDDSILLLESNYYNNRYLIVSAYLKREH